MSVQLDSINVAKCLMVHVISWSGCTSGIVEISPSTMHFDNNTILLIPSYDKRTTNRSVVQFVKCTRKTRDFGANCDQDISFRTEQ